MRGAGGIAAGVTLAIVACSSFDATNAAPPADDAGADAQPDAASAACSERVLYVSAASGSDANDGCSADKAIKSIGAAIGLVAARDVDGYEIRVCGGVYPERGLRVTRPVSLLGSYNCVTWTRGPENDTRIENAAYPSEPATLTIAGAALGREVVIDGLVVAAPASGDAPASAVIVEEGARPVLSHLTIVTGATKGGLSDGYGSAGLVVRSAAAPEVASTSIESGAGISDLGVGSIGVAVVAASVDLHDSEIDVRGGSGATGVVGARLFGATKSRFSKVQITFGGGMATGTGTNAAMGIYATGGELLEIEESRVRGQKSACASTSTCSTHGIYGDGQAKLSVHRSIVYAGEIDATTATPRCAGVTFAGGVEGSLTSNVIHAGGMGSDPESELIGLDVITAKSVNVHGNTFLSTGLSAKVRVGMRVNAPGGLGTGTEDVAVVGNIFVARNAAQDIGLGLATCGGSRYALLTRNAFISYKTTLLDLTGSNCGETASAIASDTVGSAENYLNVTGSSAVANVMLRPACFAGCFTGFDCGDSDACAAKVFASWDALTAGSATMDSAEGLRLKPSGPCVINQGAAGFESTRAMSDFFGVARTAPYSAGHHEIDACAQ